MKQVSAWAAQVEAGGIGGGGVPEAPPDGRTYGREGLAPDWRLVPRLFIQETEPGPEAGVGDIWIDTTPIVTPPPAGGESWVAFVADGQVFYCSLNANTGAFDLIDSELTSTASSVAATHIENNQVVVHNANRDFFTMTWDGTALVEKTAVSLPGTAVVDRHKFGVHAPGVNGMLTTIGSSIGSFYGANFHSYDLSPDPPVVTEGSRLGGSFGNQQFGTPVRAFRDGGPNSGYGDTDYFVFAENSLLRAGLATVDWTGSGSVTVHDFDPNGIGTFHDWYAIDPDNDWAVASGSDGVVKFTFDRVAKTITNEGIVSGGPAAFNRLAIVDNILVTGASPGIVTSYSLAGTVATQLDQVDLVATHSLVGGNHFVSQMWVDPWTHAIIAQVKTSSAPTTHLIVITVDGAGNLTTYNSAPWFLNDFNVSIPDNGWAMYFSDQPLGVT